ncbi:hypothetical protein I4U23_015682 [Adineta vaga]|nr:hypothetical protein I4U23_015682 [Adineta vaga]
MGCGFSNGIVINLDRTISFYYGGESVSGTVQLNVIEGKLEANEIYIALTGEIGYVTTRTVSNGRGQTTTYTEYHHIPFYFARITFAKLSDGQEKLIYEQGQYSWPFQILLSDLIPPTINLPQSYPHVRYYLQVVIVKPWYKLNTKETKYITVFPCVNLLRNPQCLRTTLFGNQNRKEINFKGTLNKIGFVPGELLIATFEFSNPRRVLIQSIDLLILQSFQIRCNSRESTILEITLPNIIDRNDEHIQEIFSVNIPAIQLPPSYDFQGGLQSIADVHLRYRLKFSVKVQGMFTNFHVEVPIILGTEPYFDLNQQQQPSLNPSIISCPSHTDQPPDYETVIQNIK